MNNRVNNPVKVLFVEDSEDDAKLALRALRQGGFDPTHRRVQTAAELETALAQECWDAVISDFNMPGFTGMDALRIFRSRRKSFPGPAINMSCMVWVLRPITRPGPML